MTREEQFYQASPAWVRSVLMNLHGIRIAGHRYGTPYKRLLGEFADLNKATAQQVRAWQERRLNEILNHSIKNSAYYREVLGKAGYTSGQTLGLDQLKDLPTLNKTTLRDRLPEILTSNTPLRGWLHGHTSGTTGSPLDLWYDRDTCVATNAADRLQKRFAGIGDQETIGLLLGRQVVPSGVKVPPFWHENRVQRQVWFSSLHMTTQNLDSYVKFLNSRGIRVLEGYPSTLYVLAKHLLTTGQRLPMKAVFSSSESLHDLQRDAIEAAFATRLFDYYGHAERAVFAIECREHNGKHVVDPFGIVEIVDDNDRVVPDGSPGYITGTSLFNSAMPMIRYRTGDISTLDRTQCACGSPFPRITGVSTKAEDIVVLPDGRWLSPSVLTHPFKPYPSIVKSQVIQESRSAFTVKIVADASFTSHEEQELRVALRERIGASCEVTILRVDDIPVEKSGKFRWVISRVPHELMVTW